MPVSRWRNHGEGKEETTVIGLVEGRCQESAGVRESEAFGYADREEVEAYAGRGFAKSDEARSAFAINQAKGRLADRFGRTRARVVKLL